MYLKSFLLLGFFQVNSCITLHTLSDDVVVRLIISRVLALVKRQLSWVITFITEEIYLFDTIIPQLDHMTI